MNNFTETVLNPQIEIMKKDIPLPDLSGRDELSKLQPQIEETDLVDTNAEFIKFTETLKLVQSEIQTKQKELQEIKENGEEVEEDIRLLKEFESASKSYLKRKFDWEEERNVENLENAEINGLIHGIFKHFAKDINTPILQRTSFSTLVLGTSTLPVYQLRIALNDPNTAHKFLGSLKDPLTFVNQFSANAERVTTDYPREKVLKFIRENPDTLLRDMGQINRFIACMDNQINNSSPEQAKALSIYSEVKNLLKENRLADANDLLSIGITTNYFLLLERKKKYPNDFKDEDEILLKFFKNVFQDTLKDYTMNPNYN